MNGYSHKPRRSFKKLSYALSLAIGLTGAVLSPYSVNAQDTTGAQASEALSWARIDYIRNRVQLVPRDQNGRRARISDVLSVGDSLRTSRASRAELRFNDGSLARVGERAIFRFTPDTRNFQLSNGTILLLIPPGRGRSTIQTPNATTGIQGSALFVRYIPETDTTIVGALTNNPDGPMVLINRDGTESQALRANEIGVIKGDQITELYEFDGTLFWQSSGLAEGFNYLSDTSSSGNPDQLDGVRQEIREAISTQGRLSGDTLITNPETFSSPGGDTEGLGESERPTTELEFRDSPAEEYLESDIETDERAIDIGVDNSLSALETNEEGSDGSGEGASESGQPNGQPASNADSGQSENSETNDTQGPGTAASETSTSGSDAEGTANPETTTGPVEATSDDITVESGATEAGPGPGTNTTTINRDVTTDGSAPANDASSGVPDLEIQTGPSGDSSGGPSSSETSPLPGVGAGTAPVPRSIEGAPPSSEIPPTPSGASSDLDLGSSIGNDALPPTSENIDVGAAEAAAMSDAVLGADIDVSTAASTTVGPELVTVPEGDIPLIQPVPDAIEKLDDAQPIVEMEMDDAMSTDDAMPTMGTTNRNRPRP